MTNYSQDEYLTPEQLKELEPELRACEDRNYFNKQPHRKPVHTVYSEAKINKITRPLKRNPHANYFPIMEKKNFIPTGD